MQICKCHTFILILLEVDQVVVPAIFSMLHWFLSGSLACMWGGVEPQWFFCASLAWVYTEPRPSKFLEWIWISSWVVLHWFFNSFSVVQWWFFCTSWMALYGFFLSSPGLFIGSSKLVGSFCISSLLSLQWFFSGYSGLLRWFFISSSVFCQLFFCGS